MRCCQGASAALIPPGLGWMTSPSPALGAEEKPQSHEFHLHPHYRAPRRLDAVLLKAKAGTDQFVTEKYAAEIQAILDRWTAGLLDSPDNLTAIQNVIGPNFAAASGEGFISSGLTVRAGCLHQNPLG